MESSDALSELINEKAKGLDELYDRITACHVVVEEPHNHRRKGNHFRVSVKVEVPGKELVADRDPPDDSHENAYQAVREAFHAVRRQLEDYARIRRGE
jgi:ribosome-associated translation inhibitor RaiA